MEIINEIDRKKLVNTFKHNDVFLYIVYILLDMGSERCVIYV